MVVIQGKKNQEVTIFRDPITKINPEGKAVLIDLVFKSAFAPFEETWNVQFKGDFGMTYQRTIVFES